MKLGIIGAMEQEVKTLWAAMEQPVVTTVAGMTFQEGILRGTPAVVATTTSTDPVPRGRETTEAAAT